jgi:ribosomal protein S18 acetylase RimI-like enzyme
MKTSHRDYAEAAGDFNRLARFLIENNQDARARSTWCLGRLVDWKYGLYENKLAYPAFTDQNAHLWFDGFDRLIGFVIAENGDAYFDVVILEGYRFLYEAMVRWALANWRERGPGFSTEITGQQTAEAEILEQLGFSRRSTFYTRRFDLTKEPAVLFSLAEGFTLVDMATHPDYLAQRVLRDNAFRDRDEVDEERLKWELRFYNHSHEGPLYHPETDICVMAPDGRLVAGCEALIDAHNLEADIERVCTHSAFRQRGFARAAIQECLRRLRSMGLRSAYITGYSPEAIALYGSMGAVDEARAFLFKSIAG